MKEMIINKLFDKTWKKIIFIFLIVFLVIFIGGLTSINYLNDVVFYVKPFTNKNIINKYNLEYKEFNEYTENELNNILQLFVLEQSKYPLGECIRKDLHVLFHSLYGQYNTTEEQWIQFKNDYTNGVYNNRIKMDIVA